MFNTKENKGITLMALIITVIILSILAGTATFIGIDNINKSRDQIALAEIEEVKHMVGEAYILYKQTNNGNYLNTKFPVSQAEMNSISSELGITLVSIPQGEYNEVETAYYRLTPQELLSIGVEKSEDTYIVNYVTGEVINETKLKTSENKPLYTYIRSNFNVNDITAF